MCLRMTQHLPSAYSSGASTCETILDISLSSQTDRDKQDSFQGLHCRTVRSGMSVQHLWMASSLVCRHYLISTSILSSKSLERTLSEHHSLICHFSDGQIFDSLRCSCQIISQASTRIVAAAMHQQDCSRSYSHILPLQ